MEELLAIFCDVDDFCKAYEEYCQTHLLMSKEQIIPKTSMSLSEIMTIVIYFHLSNQRTFKWYYLKFVSTILKPYFPKLVSYNRFVEIMKMSIVPLTLYLMKYRVGKCTGINFIDSTTLDVCDSHRIYSHKVFKDLAQRGKSSTGWFYGFKLHLVINDMGEILSVCLTAGNVDDRDWEVISKLTKELYGKLFADRGYLSQKLFEKLFDRKYPLNVQAATKYKSVMLK
ncbi:MAG: IS982 family transposase [Clostridia bacterium]|nr:IS982 family transposase [Clostridia bacterium]